MSYPIFFQRYSQVSSSLIFGTPANKDFLLTVFIPTYKRANLLLQAVESLLKCPEDFPIVILDNNPERNDETELVVVAHYAENKRICYYKNEVNIGMFGNWNRCFELCKTPWLYMLHDDDLIYPDGITILLKTICRNTEVAIISFQTQPFWYKSKISFPVHHRKKTEMIVHPCCMFAGNLMNPSASCFRVEKIIAAAGFDEAFFPSSDYEFVTRILRTGAKMIVSHAVIALRRVGNNESSNFDTMHKFVLQDEKLLQEHLSLFKNEKIHYLFDICKNGYLRNCIQVYNKTLPEENKIKEMSASLFEKGIYFIYCWIINLMFREILRIIKSPDMPQGIRNHKRP